MQCKVCKLKPEIINTINNLIENGISLRRIAENTISEYKQPISYQSINRHKQHIGNNLENFNLKEKNRFYYVIRPIRRH